VTECRPSNKAAGARFFYVVLEASPKRKFKAYPIGYFHIDRAEVRTAQGKPHLIVAIDRTSKFAFVEQHEKVTRRTGRGLPAPPDRGCHGFAVDTGSGRWRSNDDAEDELRAEGRRGLLLAGLKPYVTDVRNLLLVRPSTSVTLEEVFMHSLAFALRRAIQIEYQVEEQEIAIELIGRGENLSVLFWEASEGGIGVWERMVSEPREFHKIAGRALRLLHFDSESGAPDPQWEKRCTAACYDCLLSYSNQPLHRHLNRHSVRDFLLKLSHAGVAPSLGRANYDASYARLIGLLDPASSFERIFLDFLYHNRLRLPDHGQHTPAKDIAVQPDFYYDRNGVPGVCIFIDGPHHNEHAISTRDRALREALRDQGFRVVAIVHGRPLADQIAENAAVFRGV
jgi:hypothetical protein